MSKCNYRTCGISRDFLDNMAAVLHSTLRRLRIMAKWNDRPVDGWTVNTTKYILILLDMIDHSGVRPLCACRGQFCRQPLTLRERRRLPAT
jgi:hypothetical protein